MVTTLNVSMDKEKWAHSYTEGGNAKWCNHYEMSLVVSLKKKEEEIKQTATVQLALSNI